MAHKIIQKGWGAVKSSPSLYASVRKFSPEQIQSVKTVGQNFSMLVVVMMAAAGMLGREFGQLAGDKGIDGLADSLVKAGCVDIYAGRGKALQGTHAHAAAKHGFDVVVSHNLHGSKASAMFMRNRGNGVYGRNGTVSDVDDSKDVAFAKVHADSGIKSARKAGRNSNTGIHKKLL